MQFQWYPGHMTKALRTMKEDIKLIDLVIELVDARIVLSSRNPEIDTLANGKSRIVLLNKSDLADEQVTAEWMEYFQSQGIHAAKMNSKSGKGKQNMSELIQIACAQKIEKNRKKGIINRPMRAMIVGIPNVGKSTFINTFAGKACTKTGNKPGVTKGKQWIRLNKQVELLDTPGVLWPKFEDQTIGLHLAFIGSIKDELLHQIDVSLSLIEFLYERYPNLLAKKYEIIYDKDAVTTLQNIALKRNCIKKGSEPDLDKAAALLLDDFRSGKLGNISIERPKYDMK